MELITDLDLELPKDHDLSSSSRLLLQQQQPTTSSTTFESGQGTPQDDDETIIIRHKLSSSKIPQSLHLFHYDALKPLPKTGITTKTQETMGASSGGSGGSGKLSLGSIMTQAQINELQTYGVVVPESQLSESQSWSDFDGLDEDLDEILNARAARLKLEKKQSQKEEKEKEKEEEVDLKKLLLCVRESTLCINAELEIEVPFKIRSSLVLKGTHQEKEEEEEAGAQTKGKPDDTLVLVLQNGLTLLLEMFADSEGGDDDEDQDDQGTNVILMITQYWKPKLKMNPTAATLGTGTPHASHPGYQLQSHRTGKLLLDASLYNTIHLRTISTDSTGKNKYIGSTDHIYTGSKNLHTIFLQPSPDLDFVITLMQTPQRRLQLTAIRLEIEHNRNRNHNHNHNHNHSAGGASSVVVNQVSKNWIVLTTEFRIPVLMFELAGQIALVNENELVLISVHQIISCDLNFETVRFEELGFPVAYYKPSTPIMKRSGEAGEEDVDEVLIVNEAGKLFSVVVNKKGQVRWTFIKRCGNVDLVAFIMERDPRSRLETEEEEEDNAATTATATGAGAGVGVEATYFSVDSTGSCCIVKHTSLDPSSSSLSSSSLSLLLSDKESKSTLLHKTPSLAPLNCLITRATTTNNSSHNGSHNDEEIWIGHRKGVSRLTQGIPLQTDFKLPLRQNLNPTASFVHYSAAIDRFYILLSTVAESEVYVYSADENELLEVPQDYDHDEDDKSGQQQQQQQQQGLIVSEQTVYMSSFEEWWIQITRGKIHVCNPSNPSQGALSYHLVANLQITMADAFANTVACITDHYDATTSDEDENGSVVSCLRWFKLTDAVRPYGTIVRLSGSVGCMRFVVLNEFLFLLVGVGKRIDLYRESESESESQDPSRMDVDREEGEEQAEEKSAAGFQWQRTLDVCLLDSADFVSDLVANDNKLYVTSAMGLLLCYDIVSSEFDLKLCHGSSATKRITDAPLTMSLSSTHIVLRSHTDIFHLPFLNQNQNQHQHQNLKEETRPLRIIPSFEKTQATKKPLISAIQITPTKYVILSPLYLTIQSFQPHSLKHIRSQTHPTLTVKTASPVTSLTYLASYSLIFAIHTTSGQQDLSVINPQKARLTPSKFITKDRRNVFKPDERITCLNEWIVKTKDGKSKKNILMGCHYESSGMGSIKLVQVVPSKDKDQLFLSVNHTLKVPTQVHSIHSLTGESAWLIVHGGCLSLLEYHFSKSRFQDLRTLYEFNRLISDVRIVGSEQQHVLVTVPGLGIRQFQLQKTTNEADFSLRETMRINDEVLGFDYCQTIPVVFNNSNNNNNSNQEEEKLFLTNDMTAQQLKIITSKGQTIHTVPSLGFAPFITPFKCFPLTARSPSITQETRTRSVQDQCDRVLAYGRNGSIDVYTMAKPQTGYCAKRNNKESTATKGLIVQKGEVSEVGQWFCQDGLFFEDDHKKKKDEDDNQAFTVVDYDDLETLNGMDIAGLDVVIN